MMFKIRVMQNESIAEMGFCKTNNDSSTSHPDPSYMPFGFHTLNQLPAFRDHCVICEQLGFG